MTFMFLYMIFIVKAVKYMLAVRFADHFNVLTF